MSFRFSTIQMLGTTLIVAVTSLCVIVAGFTIITGIVQDETQLRVQMDLNSARTIYRDQGVELQMKLNQISQQKVVRVSLIGRHQDVQTVARLEELRRQYGLDFLRVVGLEEGAPTGRARSLQSLAHMKEDLVIRNALAGTGTYGAMIFDTEDLRQASPELAARAHVEIAPTEHSVPGIREAEERAMVLESAIPLAGPDGKVAGALCGGILLNHRSSLVDEIQRSVFGDARFENKPAGTVTVFLRDVGVATSVTRADSGREIGSRVTADAYRTVLERGERFSARTRVGSDWYLSAFDPIRDPSGEVIGMLGVGLLEDKYLDFRSNLVREFILIGIVALALSIGSAHYCSTRIRRPLLQLVDATRKISSGQLDTRVSAVQGGKEAVELAQAFNSMAESLERHDQNLNKVAKRLQQAYEESDEKNQAYLEMLGFVTHELKSPLASIVFALGSLREGLLGPLNAPQEATLKACSTSADYLNATIGNFLNLSRVEEGEIKLKLRRVHLRQDVVDHVTELLRDMAADNQMQIRCTIPAELTIVCDPGLIMSVFQNLVSNAIKYGKHGAEIFISVKTDNEAGLHTFAVYNEGQGFNIEERSKLFTKFSRFTAENYGTKSGTGLGLFVTKNIVERHGGTIFADSMPGWWARFTFTLPVEIPIPAQEEGEEHGRVRP
ncbi:MAG TPA: cache domain-containing protein [Bacteroidota bacterium]|nr:cache domain-containing protein [Bacteroidota bacterium]